MYAATLVTPAQEPMSASDWHPHERHLILRACAAKRRLPSIAVCMRPCVLCQEEVLPIRCCSEMPTSFCLLCPPACHHPRSTSQTRYNTIAASDHLVINQLMQRLGMWSRSCRSFSICCRPQLLTCQASSWLHCRHCAPSMLQLACTAALIVQVPSGCSQHDMLAASIGFCHSRMCSACLAACSQAYKPLLYSPRTGMAAGCVGYACIVPRHICPAGHLITIP